MANQIMKITPDRLLIKRGFGRIISSRECTIVFGPLDQVIYPVADYVTDEIQEEEIDGEEKIALSLHLLPNCSQAELPKGVFNRIKNILGIKDAKVIRIAATEIYQKKTGTYQYLINSIAKSEKKKGLH